MVFHPELLVVVLLAEAAVIVERLTVDRAARGAGLGDGLHSRPGTDVHEVDRGTGQLGHPQHLPERYVL